MQPSQPTGPVKRSEVTVVLHDGMQDLQLAGPLEVLSAATGAEGAAVTYRTRTASVGGGPVRTSGGLTLVPDGALGEGPVPDLLIVPGTGEVPARGSEVARVLAALVPRVARVAALCTGVFLLAESGVLAGRRVTTHWKWCGPLAAACPDARVDAAAIFVKDGPVSTCGGGTAGIDLALSLLEDDVGRDLALGVSRSLVTYLRRPGDQLQFASRPEPFVDHPGVRDAIELITKEPTGDLSRKRLAAHAGMSVRNFGRLFTAQAGMSPGRFVERVRVETARRMLESPDPPAGLEEVSAGAGFGSVQSMRLSFGRVLHVTPAEYQKRFNGPVKENAISAYEIAFENS
ncbi:transcriptional regulator GlxA family with amidase domain [Streptomyces sp. V4I8]|uniref:GlxA family transcriptional regulator n=1 Tax=Streptomyces sp. V4I8 TaxID=3156469 RepID=UPI00351312A6